MNSIPSLDEFCSLSTHDGVEILAMPGAPNLELLALAKFGKLSQAEELLVRAAPLGEFALCGSGSDFNEPANNPTKADSEWKGDRTIRASLIRWLCTDRQAKDLVNPSGIQVFSAKITPGLNLSSISIPFGLTLTRCRLTGQTDLRSAEFAGLNIQGSRTDSIAADGARINGAVFFRSDFHANGEVRFPGAKIEGPLECSGAKFENPAIPKVLGSGTAFNADGAIINGTVSMNDGFHSQGEVRLVGSQINGAFTCSGAYFENPPHPDIPESGDALTLDRASVQGSIFLNVATIGDVKLRFAAKGEVRIMGTRIGGNLDCRGAFIENPAIEKVGWSGQAFSGDRAVVNGNVFFTEGFFAAGEVRLPGIEVGGNLGCVKATFAGVLRLENACVKGTFTWLSITKSDSQRLALSGASVDSLIDEQASWPGPESLALDGFIYARFLGVAPKDASSRINWLARQQKFASQPFRQLSKVLGDSGDDSGSRQVLFEMERQRRVKEDATRFQKLWSAILQRTVGFGYFPGRALWGLVALVLLGWVIYWAGFSAGNMVPTDKDVYPVFKSSGKVTAHYDRFHAFVYSAENSFPLVKFGQVDRWQPDPNPQAHVLRVAAIRSHSLWLSFAAFLTWFRWTQIVLGWFFATMGVAAITGIVRKD